jgi:hypothetical protein
MTAADIGDQEDTILEYVVRERLSKEQLSDLLASLGGQKTGSRVDLSERLLAIKGLRARDALSKLGMDDLKLVIRRFGIPEPAKPSGIFGLASSVLGDDRSSMLKRIEDVAIQQRSPRPRSEPKAPVAHAATTTLGASASNASEPRVAETESVAAGRKPGPYEPLTVAPSQSQGSVQLNVSVSAAPAASHVKPSLSAVVTFIEGYKFGGSWPDEDGFEAELLGALRTRFEGAFNQVSVAGGKIDIKVGDIGVEVKKPKTAKQAQDLVGQILKYKGQFGPNLIAVVIVGDVREHSLSLVFDQIRANEVTVVEKHA